MNPLLVALLVGVVQGVLEWLPVSSEGSVALLLTVVANADPAAAVQYALFLHVGTALAAATYYRDDLVAVARRLPAVGSAGAGAFEGGTADVAFLLVATLVSALVGGIAYGLLADLASELTGGAFVALIGLLLVVTGVLQRTADRRGGTRRARPDLRDALLVGALQGLAILPGVSRSGTTVSALLLRGHEGVDSLRLSFLLSIPAALGAGALVVLDTGLPGLDPVTALLALLSSALVGFLTVGALVGLVRRVAFWGVCVGFGTLAVLGGAILLF